MPPQPPASKPLPIPGDVIAAIAERVPTPFYLYDEGGIRANAIS